MSTTGYYDREWFSFGMWIATLVPGGDETLCMTRNVEQAAEVVREHNALVAEVRSLRGVVQAVEAAKRGVAEMSATIDASYPADLDAEAHMWRRHRKVCNEAAEVLEAIEGAIGENPRKGVTKTWADVDKELLDTANAALGAYEYNHGNDGSSIAALFAHIEFVRHRLAAAADAPQPGPERANTPTAWRLLAELQAEREAAGDDDEADFQRARAALFGEATAAPRTCEHGHRQAHNQPTKPKRGIVPGWRVCPGPSPAVLPEGKQP